MQRVAIVGSGMAGLVTAYLLNQDVHQRYAVSLFESGEQLALDSASLSVSSPTQEKSERIDLPMRAFAGGFYDNLKAMYDYLGIEYHAQPFLFAFSKVFTPDAESIQKEQAHSYFVHSSNNHRILPVKPRGMRNTSWLVEVAYVLVCYVWYSICCFLIPCKFAAGNEVCETLDQYLRRIKLPQYFVTHYLLPLISGVSTCPHDALLRFPASDIIEYKKRTHGAQHYTVSNGVHAVQKKLAKGLDTRLSAMVLAVEPNTHGVKLSWRHAEDTHELAPTEEFFDKIILAVSPDAVGKIFSPLRHEMARVPTLSVESIIHTDYANIERLGPHEQRDLDHSAAQMIHLRTLTESSHITESIHIQPSGAIVTTCPFSYIDPAQIIQSVRFTRVLRTPESRQVINKIFRAYQLGGEPTTEEQRTGWKNGDGGVWLAGGWCWDGMVLLEGCLVSAIRVADDFGVDIPWR